MSELSSIYLKVHISQPQYEKWLASPMRHMHEYDDWHEMTEQWEDSWRDYFYASECKTIGGFVWLSEKEMFAASAPESGSRPYVNYNAVEGVFRYARLFYDENFINYMVDLSAFRSLADFKDSDDRDFLVIYPYFWEEGYDVIMEIGRGKVTFHSESNIDEDFMSFIEEANACMAKEKELLAYNDDDE